MTFRPGLAAYVAGLLLVLAGDVLPWFRERGAWVWGWDVSVLWAVSGRLSLVGTPPAAAAVVLVAAMLLAEPVVRGRRISAPFAAGLAGLVIATGGLTLFRGLAVVPPHAGLIATLAGGVLLALGAVLLAED